MHDDELFEMRKKFGVLFQDGALFGSMNLLDNVAFPLRQHTDKGEDEILEIVNRRLREVGLADAGDKMPNELSGGMRKRAGFARALVLDPDIVLFDEPDSGLDPVRTALLCELIQEIHEENGGAYVVITHDIMSARRVAEYISVLWKGRIVESGPGRGALQLRQRLRPPVPVRRVAGAARHGVAPHARNTATAGCAEPTHRNHSRRLSSLRPELAARQTSAIGGPRVTAARGVALGALALAVAVVAVLLLARRRRAHLQAALPERRPARQGRRRAGRRPAHRLGPRDRR